MSIDIGLYVLAVLGWLACGVVAYGGTLAYFQRKFSMLADDCFNEARAFALVHLAFGPIGLLWVLVGTSLFGGRPFRYGFQFQWKKRQ